MSLSTRNFITVCTVDCSSNISHTKKILKTYCSNKDQNKNGHIFIKLTRPNPSHRSVLILRALCIVDHFQYNCISSLLAVSYSA